MFLFLENPELNRLYSIFYYLWRAKPINYSKTKKQKKMIKRMIFFLAGVLFITVANAQIRVTGKVVDFEGIPIPGVSVVEQGTANGITTQLDGSYSLSVQEDAVLSFSFIGMESKNISVKGKRVVDVTLRYAVSELDEVVVVGYGVQKKSDITGAVASVDFDDLKMQPINTVDDAIKGRVAGVQVYANSGAPGGSVSVRIRGVGTVNNADPLYVVDGIPVSDINFLNPNDIASLEVLKDASSSAIYGSRGANGVVLITTKSGKLNMPAIVSVNSYYGIKEALNNWETTTGAEWYGIQETLNKTRTSPLNLGVVDKNVNTDWFDEITRVAAVQDYNVSITGGSDKMTYIAGGGYYSEEGTIEGADFDRITARLKTDYKVKDWMVVGANINMQQNEKHTINEANYRTGTVNSAIKIEPVIPVWKDEAKGIYDYSKFTDYVNPVAQIAYNNYRREQFRLLGNTYVEIEPIKNLKLKSSYGIQRTVSDTYDFVPIYEVNINQRNLINKVSKGNRRAVSQVWENTVTYDREIEKHNVSLLAGFTKEKSRSEWESGSKNNIPNEDPTLWFFDAATDGDLVTGAAAEYTMMSYLGRVNYSYDNKYLLTASFRADGSSRFSEGNRWGYFPSLALGWKISNEKFLRDIDWLSSLKIRTGWGQIGNQNIGVYPYQTTMNGSAQYRYLFGLEEDVFQGYVITAMKDKNIKWETVESLNFGIDGSFFKNRLDISLDWFNKDTKDMLLGVPIPYYYGYENGPVVNVGEVNNKGLEFAANWKNQVSKDFSYNIGFNISTYKNKMISLGNGSPISGGTYLGGSSTRTEVGESIGYFYGYKTAGVFQTQEEIKGWAVQQGKDNSGLEIGDMKFVDVNGDGKVNDEDRTKIGSPDPDFTYGINLGANYKGWEFSAFLQGTQGNDIFNGMKAFLYAFDETNKHKDMLNSWTPENRNTNMPRLDGNDVNNTNRTSDRFVEDGSYLRLKNVTLGYNFPNEWLEKVKISSAKLYVSAQNLFTFTNYSGADPEIGQMTATNYLSRGLDNGTYPQARTFIVGLRIDF